jgi:hypothetical protein
MVDYTTSLIWLGLWPLIIFLGYKFAAFNMAHFTRLESLMEKEKELSGADA